MVVVKETLVSGVLSDTGRKDVTEGKRGGGGWRVT